MPDGKPGEYLTDRLTDEAEKFLESHKDKPFYLNLSHYAVHTPIQAKEEITIKFDAKEKDEIKGHTNAKYAAMIKALTKALAAFLKR